MVKNSSDLKIFEERHGIHSQLPAAAKNLECPLSMNFQISFRQVHEQYLTVNYNNIFPHTHVWFKRF
jgi:hypothetical protein